MCIQKGTFDVLDDKAMIALGDCLEVMKEIPDNSIDMCLTDPPYGTTACKWDSVIPFEPMWEQLKRIVKDNGAICLFGSEPFSSHLRLSNLKMFKYDWIWAKNAAANFMLTKTQPLKFHEIISIFSIKKHNYYPQKEQIAESSKKRYKYDHKGSNKPKEIIGGFVNDQKPRKYNNSLRNPSSIRFFDLPPRHKGLLHPTQKPVALLEYLIKTYTLENETVLDFTAGSFSTGVAAVNLNRRFVGIEQDENYFNIGKRRVQEAIDAKVPQ